MDQIKWVWKVSLEWRKKGQFWLLSLEGIRFLQITSRLRWSDPQVHMASDASFCRRTQKHTHAHVVWEKTLITGLTWHNISSLFTHSHAGKLQLESWQIVCGPLFLSSSDGRLWISDWKLHTDSDEAYAPSVRINRKSSLFSVWLIGILVSVSLRVQMNPDELFLDDKRSNIRVSPSSTACCFLLSRTDLTHGTLQEAFQAGSLWAQHTDSRKKDDTPACHV